MPGNETLALAAQKMWDADRGVLPVVGGDDRLVGVLTDRDICMSAWSQGRLLTEKQIHKLAAICQPRKRAQRAA